jgi:uncharacterized membrane protein
MGKERMMAFTDGVVAIIITIMVLELKVPHGTTLADLVQIAPTALSYLMSFVYVAIYWNNHHHLLHLGKSVNGAMLWANMHLLFWLSLAPFVTRWMGENYRSAIPVACYGGVLMMDAVAFTILAMAMEHHEGPESAVTRALGNDLKGKLSLVIYAAGIALAFVQPFASLALYAVVAAIWVVPDRRVERVLGVAER